MTATNPANWGAAQVSATDTHLVVLNNNSNAFTHERYSGTAWAAGNTIASLTLNTSPSGIALVSDGSSVWMFAIDSSKNITYNKWTSGGGWGGWTVLEATRTNTPNHVTACYSAAAGGILVAWTEYTGSNYNIIGSFLSTAAAATFYPWIFGDENYEKIG